MPPYIAALRFNWDTTKSSFNVQNRGDWGDHASEAARFLVRRFVCPGYLPT